MAWGEGQKDRQYLKLLICTGKIFSGLEVRDGQNDRQSLNLCIHAGEIFSGLEVPGGQNDRQCLLEALAACSSVTEVMQRIRGPWTFIYWAAQQQQLWFGCDAIGIPQTSMQATSMLLSQAKPSSLLFGNSTRIGVLLSVVSTRSMLQSLLPTTCSHGFFACVW